MGINVDIDKKLRRMRLASLILGRLNVIVGSEIVVALLREQGIPWSYISAGLIGILCTYIVPRRKK